jgi:tRNA-dihydrouridine synthase
VVARGCGGGLIGQNALAAEIIAATKEGAGDLPVSVKTRVGLGKIITEEWCGWLLGQDLAALTVHGRTVREMSRVPSRWNEIAKVVLLRDQMAPNTIIIGNGDAANRAQGTGLAATTGADGIMIGRGVFHDLFCFAAEPREHTPAEMLGILLRHLDLYEQHGRVKPYQTLKKFFKIYVNSWPGAAELRANLMDTKGPDEARLIIANYKA